MPNVEYIEFSPIVRTDLDLTIFMIRMKIAFVFGFEANYSSS